LEWSVFPRFVSSSPGWHWHSGLAPKVKQRFDLDMKNYRDKKSVWDNEEMPRWQRAKGRWEQLYYCMRDETVFIPAENKAVDLDDMGKYLYDPYFKG
jgi:hypothetical protein